MPTPFLMGKGHCVLHMSVRLYVCLSVPKFCQQNSSHTTGHKLTKLVQSTCLHNVVVHEGWDLYLHICNPSYGPLLLLPMFIIIGSNIKDHIFDMHKAIFM